MSLTRLLPRWLLLTLGTLLSFLLLEWHLERLSDARTLFSDMLLLLLAGALFSAGFYVGLKRSHTQVLRKEEGLRKTQAQVYENERSLLEEQQKKLLDELSRSNTDLEQFAYVASHDLKSPLRAIESISGWLQEDLEPVLRDDSRQHLALLRQRARRMERLLDDLLAYSRAGKVAADVLRVDVGDLVADIVYMISPSPGFQVLYCSEALRFDTAVTPLRQVLTNLIANAIKHHDHPTGLVEVRVLSRDAWLDFSVADDGPGIPEEFHERIFGMFQTLRSRDDVEGSGIGLALVSRVVTHYGGTVRVECRQPRGSVFHFSWPLRLFSAETRSLSNPS